MFDSIPTSNALIQYREKHAEEEPVAPEFMLLFSHKYAYVILTICWNIFS